ncbi:MAG: phosphotransferase family protein [Solirubrobacteraceae bacterium]|nr:phosphotransferase family protein [Solirubrobacteraceae bacterium]
MALANTIDPTTVGDTLAAWLRGRLPDATDLRVTDATVPKASGMSTETILFTYAWTQDGAAREQRAVVRLAPAGPGLFMGYDLEREARVMDALASRTDLPVPAVLFAEDDTSVLGAPFFVMEHADGRVPADDPPFTTAGWVMDLDPAERGRLCRASLATLAALHDVDLAAVGLDDLGPADPAAALDAEIAHWRSFFAWAGDGDPHPVLDPALAWLDAHRPADLGPRVLSWGDARPGNMLFADDLSVTAILDWEMVGVGPREQDLAWWVYLLRHHTDGMDVPLPEGMPTPDEAIAIYVEASGHEPRNLDYFMVLAGVRLAALVLRAARLMIAAEFLPPDAPMGVVNPATRILAGLVDVPVPTGDAAYYVGNR